MTSKLQTQVNPIDLEIVLVQGGLFIADSSTRSYAQVNGVGIKSFFIAQYPVSQKQYATYCKAVQISLPDTTYWGKDEEAPITNVSRIDAENYCKWLSEQTEMNFRLPSTLEWKYAVKGGRAFNRCPGGNGMPLDLAKHNGKQNATAKAYNKLGIYYWRDLLWEWGANEYTKNFGQASASVNKVDWIDPLRSYSVLRQEGDFVYHQQHENVPYSLSSREAQTKNRLLGFRITLSR